MAVVTLKPHASNPITLETTSLNSLATTGTVTGTAYTANTTDRYLYADFELLITYGTNPTAGSVIELSLLRSLDGTNYEDAPGPGGYAGGFVLAATTSAQRLVIRGVPVPPFKFKPYIAAKTTGQTAAASGNILIMNLYTPEVA
jgi:hypothetical protein